MNGQNAYIVQWLDVGIVWVQNKAIESGGGANFVGIEMTELKEFGGVKRGKDGALQQN